jgi:glutamate N-acetyltransferase/amino-acid N-acetyltransferase
VAAPVTVGRNHLKSSGGKLRATLVNAGNANCATGKQGIAVCEKSCKVLATALNTKPEHILPSSTGIIGIPLPVDKLISGIPSLLEARGNSPDHAMAFARAIMTTDTRPKIATAQIRLGENTATILGVAKGAGMIHPNMATMLAYVVTDVAASVKDLNQVLKHAADRSFNRISIDGDTSTNDTLSLLASGASQLSLGNKEVKQLFVAALNDVCGSLSEQIIDDGEGVKHVVQLQITGAKSEREAEQIAKTIAHSPLVKTAWAGADPNWGRILAAIGRSGIELDPKKIDIYFGDIQVCRRGGAHPFSEADAHTYLLQRRFDIKIDLKRGNSAIEFLTCDLTAEYVHINADYTT